MPRTARPVPTPHPRAAAPQAQVPALGGSIAVLAVVAAAILGLAGCAAAPPADTEPVAPLPPQWAGLDTRGTNAVAGAGPIVLTATDTPDLARWWQSFGDAELSGLVEQALAANTDVRLAQARLRQARAQSDLARAQQLPGVEASAQGSRTKSSAGSSGVSAQRNAWSAGLDASWEADIFGARRAASAAAQADVQARLATLQSTQVSIAAEVALNLVELRSLQQRIAIAQRNLQSQTETWQLTDWRVQAGLGSSLDAEQARANLEQTRAQLPSLIASAAQVEDRLAVLLGRSTAQLRAERAQRAGTAGQAQTAPLPTVPARLTIGIPAAVIAQRPDVRAAERQYAAERARLSQAQAARYPSLNLSAALGSSALHLDDLFEAGSGTRSLIASLTAPLWDAGRIRSQIEAQDAVVEQARVNLEATLWQALADVEDALAAIQQGRDRTQALQAALDAARNAALLARQRYAGGLIDFQTVLSTERTLLQAEDTLASAQADAVTHAIRLYKAVGGGWAASEGAAPAPPSSPATPPSSSASAAGAHAIQP